MPPSPAPRNHARTAQQMTPLWDTLDPFEPNTKALMENHVLTWTAHPDANPFDILRTKIYLLMREHNWTRLAITSPDKSCGKPTMACNLAVGFTRQHELKSILLEFDLRRPGVARCLGMEPKHDIAALVQGEVSAEAQMQRLRDNVALSAALSSVPDPTRLLLADKTAKLLDTLQSDFQPDVMIFDLPPMLCTDDARATLRNVDCALIIAAAEQTRMGQLDLCEREVA